MAATNQQNEPPAEMKGPEHREYVEEIEFVNSSILKAVKYSDVDEICESICESIRSAIPGSMVAISLFDDKLGAIRIRAISGIKEHHLKIAKLLGDDPRNFKFNPLELDKTYKHYTTGELIHIKGGLRELMSGQAPAIKSKAVEKLMKVKSVYTAGFANTEMAKGGVVIFLQKDGFIRFKPGIETIVAYLAEILQRRQAEKLLIENEKMHRTLAENIQQGVVIATANPVHLAFANPSMEYITGYTPGELTNMSPQQLSLLIHEEDRPGFFSNFQQRIEGESRPPGSEYRLVHRDGSIRFMYVYSSLITYQDKPATLTTFVDISDKKSLELKHREYVAEIEFINQAIIDANRFTRMEDITESIIKSVQSANQESIVIISLFHKKIGAVRIEAISGMGKLYPKISKILGKDLKEIRFDPNQLDRGYEYYLTGDLIPVEGGVGELLGGQFSKMKYLAVEKLLKIKSILTAGFSISDQVKGGVLIILRKEVNIKFKSGIETIVAFLSEMYKRRYAESSLEESEAKFKSLTDTAQVIISIIDASDELKYLYVNNLWKEYFGYTDPGEISKLNPLDFVHPEMKSTVLQNASRRISGGEPPDRYELKVITKSGMERALDFSAKRIQFDGKPAILTTAIDMTAQKEAEQESKKQSDALERQLQKSEDQKGQLIKTMDQLNRTTNDLKQEINDRKKAEEVLKLHQEQLEKIVHERTRDLEEKNDFLQRMNAAMVERELRMKELFDENEMLKKKEGSEPSSNNQS